MCKEERALEMFHRCSVFPLGRTYTCKPCQKIRARKHYEQNRAKNAEQCAAWRAANPEKVKGYRSAWYERNRELNYQRTRAWLKAHPADQAYWVAHRRAVKHAATPAWRNPFFIREIYDLAKLRTKYLGVPYHVDHIVPLRHPLVCGLHVEHNLRVVPASENQRKGNRTWPDMP